MILSQLGKPLSVSNKINDSDRYNVSLKNAKGVSVTESGFMRGLAADKRDQLKCR